MEQWSILKTFSQVWGIIQSIPRCISWPKFQTPQPSQPVVVERQHITVSDDDDDDDVFNGIIRHGLEYFLIVQHHLHQNFKVHLR